MDSLNQVAVLFLILTVISHNAIKAQCEKGWFGNNCLFQCHCAGATDCDGDDGSCAAGCHPNWFGPACQYESMNFTIDGGSGLGWLKDKDDASCNEGPTQAVTVTLDTPIPLTWLRVVVSDPAYLNQIQVHYYLNGSSESEICQGRSAKVDDTTLDMICPTLDVVGRVSLSGAGVGRLCSLYISGGRNVALKQTAELSSRYKSYNNPNKYYFAKYAVDGILSNLSNVASTCTLNNGTLDAGWWMVTLSQAADITRFRIHGENGRSYGKLYSFLLTAKPESSTETPFTYKDPHTVGHPAYTIVPSPKLNFNVKQVRIDEGTGNRVLVICEVLIFGEIPCAPGRFGLECERQCNCADRTETCFVHNGGCPSGCPPGFLGENCLVCPPGLYGDDCKQICSETCGGDNNLCDKSDGACSHGCDAGYMGRFCDQKCLVGKYGPGCSERCSFNCGKSIVNLHYCDHVNGTCTYGCDVGYYGDMCDTKCNSKCSGSGKDCDSKDGRCTKGCKAGYQGDMCDKECSAGTYGPGCSQSCSKNCAGADHACDRIYGSCTNGCVIGYGSFQCVQKCSPTRYGLGCSEDCPSNCNNGECHHIDGTCDRGCKDGYHGILCQFKCDAGKYGKECRQTCSDHCAEAGNPCDHVTGECTYGCDPGYYTDTCILPISGERQSEDGSGWKTWGIVATVGLVAAAVAIGVLVWRLYTTTRRPLAASASNNLNGAVEFGPQMDVQIEATQKQTAPVQ